MHKRVNETHQRGSARGEGSKGARFLRPRFWLVLLVLCACSSERGEIAKRDLPEYFGVFAAEPGQRAKPLPHSPSDIGPNLSPKAIFIVYLQGLSRYGSPGDRIRLLDRSRIRYEVEQVTASRGGPIIRSHLHIPREQFVSFKEIPLLFRPASTPDMLVAVSEELLVPGLYVIQVDGELYPFTVDADSQSSIGHSKVMEVDRYFVTLDSSTVSSIEELQFSQRGLFFGGESNSIDDNAILEELFRKTPALDEDMRGHRAAALAALGKEDYLSAVTAAMAAFQFFPEDGEILEILQNGPKAAAEAALINGRWEQANEWLERGRIIAPDKDQFEGFAKHAAFDSAMGEMKDLFVAGKFEEAASGQAGVLAPDEKSRQQALNFTRKAWFEHHMDTARRERDIGDVDKVLEASLLAHEFDAQATEARQLAAEAREHILSDPDYFGEHFKVLNRIQIDIDRLWRMGFTLDGKRLHAYFDSHPRHFAAWEVATGVEIERRELQGNYNYNVQTRPSMLASLLYPVGLDPHSARRTLGRNAQNERAQTLEFVIHRFHTEEPAYKILVDPSFAGADCFLSRSDRLVAIAPKTDDGRFVLADPVQGAILHTVKLPFVSELGLDMAHFGDRQMQIQGVVFSRDLQYAAAHNGYGVAVCRVADGTVLYSAKNKNIAGLFGVSDTGEEIAFASMFVMMAGADWYQWNLGDGSEPKTAQSHLGRWAITPSQKRGFVEINNTISVFAPGSARPLAQFPAPKEEGERFSIGMGSPIFDLSPDGRKLAIGANNIIEIWGLQPPALPEWEPD